jgi:CBS-domain-containing membrane protein
LNQSAANNQRVDVCTALPETLPILARRDRFAAEGLSLLYIASISAIASFAGVVYILFPELGALSHDVLRRPWGKWASQPLRLVATPTLTAVTGTLITRHLGYHVFSVLLVVCSSMAVIFLLRSAIAPAMSAGALPLILGVKTWLYPPSILLGVTVLVALSAVWRKYCSARYKTSARASHLDVDEIIETAPQGRYWLLVFLAFISLTAVAAQISGLHFILFPPLITIAYEMFGHPEVCPWLNRPYLFPVACFLTAIGGLMSLKLLGTGAIAAGCSMGFAIFVLGIFHMHMPPALAIGLLPFVMKSPNFTYPISVGFGTLVLTGMFVCYRRLSRKPPWSQGD